jgi:predicted nucleic acid-binding protein
MVQVDGSKITAKFLSHLDDSLYILLPVEFHHYKLARDWVGQFSTPLRSLDAVHLAVASQEEATIVTCDKALASSAELLAVDFILMN